jgi:hypothetical protein
MTESQHDHHVRAYNMDRDWCGSVVQNDDGFYDIKWIERFSSEYEWFCVVLQPEPADVIAEINKVLGDRTISDAVGISTPERQGGSSDVGGVDGGGLGAVEAPRSLSAAQVRQSDARKQSEQPRQGPNPSADSE